MAIYNEILTARYPRLIQRLFGMKGPQAVRQVAGEITATLNLFGGAELRYLEGWNRFGFATTVAAAAAINSTLRIRNPSGSNIVAVLEKVSASPGVADAIILGMVRTTADLVVIAPGTNNNLDFRQGFNGPNCILSTSDATHPGSLITTVKGASVTNQTYEFVWFENQEIAVLPGQAVDVFESTVNTACGISFMWRERFLEESERAS